MAHRKQFLHEMLQEDQEPFRLKTYIADRRSQLKKPSSSSRMTGLQHRKAVVPEKSSSRGNLCKHVCFFAFQSSQDVLKSPFRDFAISPAKSPCKSPSSAVFLHIPSRTAALLLEAAMRIQKQQKPKFGGPSRNARFGLFGSLVKRLKDRSKNKKRCFMVSDFRVLEDKAEANAAKPCSHSDRRISCAEWTEGIEASTSSYGSEWSEDNFERRFCVSPFRFSFHRSPSSNGRHTPEFCSPVASPSRRLSKDKENYEPRKPDKGEEDEEKDQSSPVSVLDPVFQGDDGPKDECNDDDEYEIGCSCSYANVQRAKEQLLVRLQRFEKLAELNPMELEQKLIEESEDEADDDLEEREGSEHRSRKLGINTLVTEVLNQTNLQTFPADMKKLVCDLITEEKNEAIWSREAVVGRICKRLDLWKDVELDTIDMMVGLDMKKKETDGWTKFVEQVEETTADMEVAVSEVLVDELLEELCYIDRVVGFDLTEVMLEGSTDRYVLYGKT